VSASTADEVATTSVLVIEDNDLLREIIGLMLADAGHRVTLARDGREGLRNLARQTVDVVVSDVAMPGLDGWDVARAVRQAAPHVGIVLMSGTFEPGDRGTARAGGVVLLPKPFALHELTEAIERALASRRETAA
jgi:CheY-like chemotaxis protein